MTWPPNLHEMTTTSTSWGGSCVCCWTDTTTLHTHTLWPPNLSVEMPPKLDRKTPPNLKCASTRPPTSMQFVFQASTCRQCEIWSKCGKQYAAQVSLGWMELGLPKTWGKLRQVDYHVNTRSNCSCGRHAHLTQMPYAPVWTWGSEVVHKYVI